MDERPPLEAQLIDIADEIAYNCADLDDGYEVQAPDLAARSAKACLFLTGSTGQMEKKYPAAKEKLKFNEALKRLLDALVTDLIESTRAAPGRGRGSARWGRSVPTPSGWWDWDRA